MAGRLSVPVAIAACLAVSGCSIAIPIPSLMGSDDAVGTIKAVPVLSVRLAGEDIRKADAALTKALEAKVRTGVVAWQNPQSGARGSFTVAAGSAGPCRPFAATVEVDATSEMVVGSACRNASGSWAIDAITARTPG